MNNELLIRKIELMYGLYSHPDVAKFIFNVLQNFEIQKEKNDKCFGFGQSSPAGFGFSTSGFGQHPTSGSGFTTSGSGFSTSSFGQHPTSGIGQHPTSGSGFSTSGSGFSTSGFGQHPTSSFGQHPTSGSGFTTSGSGFSTSGFGQHPTSGFGQHPTSGIEQNFIENQKSQTNFTLGSSNTFTFGQNNVNDQDSESKNISNNLYTFGINHLSNSFENLKNHLYYENILYKNNIPQTDFFNFKILFGFDSNTKDFIIADKNNIEINYSNYKNYKNKNIIWLEDQYIFDEIILKLPLIQNNELNESLFEKIHYFLKGFEKFLIELFLPNKFSKKFIEILDKFLTLPVLLAFSNEFENTRFSYKLYIMKHKIIDLTFYQKYNDRKNYHLKYFPSNEKEIDHFLTFMNHNFNFLNYF